MRVKIIRKPQGPVRGMWLVSLQTGLTYNLRPEIARALLSRGDAFEERRWGERRRAMIDERLLSGITLAGEATSAMANKSVDPEKRNPEKRADRRVSSPPLERLSGKFAYRRCQMCEWEGQLAYTMRGGDPDCPVCHAPTSLVAVLQPMSQSDSLQKNPHAAALGRLGGQRGGPARAALLSPKRRREIARKAALARWKGRRGDK